MKTAKIGAIFVISFMALAGTGSAYALWYDYLHLDVDVETGWIGAEWSVEAVYDSEPDDKDFSHVEAILSTWGGTADDPNLNGRMFVHIYNGYPCINYYVNFNIDNTGTIPIHIGDPEVYVPGNNNLNGDGLDYGTIDFFDMSGDIIVWDDIQIHPNQAFYGTMVIHFNNDLPQGGPDVPAIWIYCVEFPYYQWNEPYPMP